MLISDASGHPMLRAGADADHEETRRNGRVTCIVGLGATGILGAVALGRGSEDRLVLVGRPSQEPAISADGLHITGVLGDLSLSPKRCDFFGLLSAVPRGTRFDRVLIFVKCYDVENVVNELAHRRDLICDHTAFFCFQNGWASHEPLLALADKDHIFHARVTTEVHWTALTRVIVTVDGDDILIGSLAPNASLDLAADLAREISAGGVPARATPDISRFMWSKVIYDAGISALGALYGCTTASLVNNPDIRLEVECLLEETFRVVKRAGYTTGFGTFEAYREFFFSRLISRTADQCSSMLQDLDRDLPRTEIDWINGAVSRLARENGIFAGLNELITRRIHLRESQQVQSKPVQLEISLKIGSNRAVSEPSFGGVEDQARRTA